MNSQQKYTILVVDDELGIRRFFEKRLRSWGYEVFTAESGRQAQTLMQSENPQVVITDLFMPHGDGFELLSFLKKTEPDLPIIVVSGQGERGDVIRALRLGAWDYLYKPIEEASFLKMALEKALEKARLIEDNKNYQEHLEELVALKSAELAASEKRYRTVADFTYDWEYWIDPDGRILYISPSCERIAGYAVNQFVENAALIHDIIHPEDRETYTQHLTDSRLQQEACELDFRIKRLDGEQRWIGHCCQPVFDPQGAYLGRRCSNRDITYQKKIENNLMRQQNELMNKTISLEKANEALKSLLDQREIEKKSIEQSMVTNLKRFVFPYLDDLDRQKIGKDAKNYVKIIHTNIEQLISPVSKNLSGAYLDLTPTEIKVADLIRQGQSTKSIADTLNTSPSTVEKHRNKIRKKLNILNKKVNLYTYLNSLA